MKWEFGVAMWCNVVAKLDTNEEKNCFEHVWISSRLPSQLGFFTYPIMHVLHKLCVCV